MTHESERTTAAGLLATAVARAARVVRGIEPAFRNGMLRALCAVGDLAARRPPDWDSRPRRVLYLRMDAVGDMILSTGLLRSIRARHPGITIDVLTLESNRPVFEANPDVDRVIGCDPKQRGWLGPVLRAVRGRGYYAVVDGMIERDWVRTRTIVIGLASGARYRIGIAGVRNDFYYTLPVARRPRGTPHAEALGALGEPFGVPREADLRPRLPLSDGEIRHADREWVARGGHGPRVLVNLSASHARRRWSDERFAAALRHLRAHLPSANIGILAMPRDAESARELGALCGARPYVVSLRELFGLVATADLVFTPDTAVVHAASAFGTPTVAMLVRGQLHFAPYRTPNACAISDTESLDALPFARVVPALDEGIAIVRRREGRRAARTAPRRSPTPREHVRVR